MGKGRTGRPQALQKFLTATPMLFWIPFTVIQVLSLGFLTVNLLLLQKYVRHHPFEESQYTLLFSFIGSRHVILAYIAVVVLWTTLTTLITFLVLNG
jgi:hypothetical protein